MANDIDQDALAAEWGLALDSDGKPAPAPTPAPKAEATKAKAPVDPDNMTDEELAAAWAAEAGGGDGAAEGDDDVASQWAAMVDDNQAQVTKGADRILNQEEIDGLLGFNLAELSFNDLSLIHISEPTRPY